LESSTVLTATVVGELLLAVSSKLRNSLPDVVFSTAVLTAVVVDDLLLSVMGEHMNRLPDVRVLAVVVDVLLLSDMSGVISRTDYLTFESFTILPAVAICQQLLTVRGQFRNSLPEVGVLYSLDSCGCW
jgi:hypothetical protein